MPNINDKLAVNPINALRDFFGQEMPIIRSDASFAQIAPTHKENNLMQFDSLQHQAQAIAENSVLTLKKEGDTPSNIRYLKWQENHCTGMMLDKDAHIFFTGPFQGCSFFMFKNADAGLPGILHSNSNEHRGDPSARNKKQYEMARDYAERFHPGNWLNIFEAQYEIHMRQKQGWIIGVKLPSEEWRIHYIITEPLGSFPQYYLDIESRLHL